MEPLELNEKEWCRIIDALDHYIECAETSTIETGPTEELLEKIKTAMIDDPAIEEAYVRELQGLD